MKVKKKDSRGKKGIGGKMEENWGREKTGKGKGKKKVGDDGECRKNSKKLEKEERSKGRKRKKSNNLIIIINFQLFIILQ